MLYIILQFISDSLEIQSHSPYAAFDMKILLTGAAGFIGFHTAKALLARGDEVIGLDFVELRERLEQDDDDHYEPDYAPARGRVRTEPRI